MTELFPKDDAYEDPYTPGADRRSVLRPDSPKQTYMDQGTYWIGDLTYLRQRLDTAVVWSHHNDDKPQDLQIARRVFAGPPVPLIVAVTTETGEWAEDLWTDNAWTVWVHDPDSADVLDRFRLLGGPFGMVNLNLVAPELVGLLDSLASFSYSSKTASLAKPGQILRVNHPDHPKIKCSTYANIGFSPKDAGADPTSADPMVLDVLLGVGKIMRFDMSFIVYATRGECFGIKSSAVTTPGGPEPYAFPTILNIDFKTFREQHSEAHRILHEKMSSDEALIAPPPSMPFIHRIVQATEVTPASSSLPELRCENCARPLELKKDGWPDVNSYGDARHRGSSPAGYRMYCTDELSDTRKGKVPKWFVDRYGLRPKSSAIDS